MKLLDGDVNRTPVVAGHPYNHFLALPRLGYVTTPPPGYSTLPLKNTQHSFREIKQLVEDKPRKLVFVWAANGFYSAYSEYQIQRPSDRDRIVYDDGLHH